MRAPLFPGTIAAAAAALLLAACGARVEPGGPAAPATTRAVQVDSARILRVLSALAHDSLEGRQLGSAGGARARALLVRELETRAIPPLGAGYEQPFTAATRSGGARAGANLLALVRGTTQPARHIVVSAHYDHVGVRNGEIYNGADDNASGTAVALELASWFRAHPPAHSILIALFDGEEAGLHGARAFLDAAPVPLEQVALNVNLDMVGRSDRDELFAVGTHHYPWLRPVVERVAARSELTLRAGHDTGAGAENWTGASDHAAFHARGIPFLYFGVEDHADYHRPSDDFEGIQPGFITRAARTIIDAVRTLDAELPGRAGG